MSDLDDTVEVLRLLRSEMWANVEVHRLINQIEDVEVEMFMVEYGIHPDNFEETSWLLGTLRNLHRYINIDQLSDYSEKLLDCLLTGKPVKTWTRNKQFYCKVGVK